MALSRRLTATRACVRAGAIVLVLAGAVRCGDDPELVLHIRVPPDDLGLFQAVAQLNLTAKRDEIVLAQQSFAATTASVSLKGVTHGPRTIIELEGVDRFNQIIAHGRTCPLSFEGANTVAALYFAPTNFFAPTVDTPAARYRPVAAALSDGNVLIVGGHDDQGNALASAALFVPGAARFETIPDHAGARKLAASAWLPDVGLLIVGGLDGDDHPIAEAEVFLDTQRQFVPIADPRLEGRIGHQMVTLPDGRAMVTGGITRDATGPVTLDTTLATTLYFAVLGDGTYRVTPGPVLAEARHGHAATVAIGVPIVFGGYNAAGVPVDSIEALNVPYFMSQIIARLRTARAEATASVLPDGSILLVGGIGPDGQPLADAELFNPITRSTDVYALAFPRHGHSATVLRDGRVLIAGGDVDGTPSDEVELFVAGVGFLSERRLGTARGNHLAVPLCDETVLLTGGGDGAEVYSGAPR
jgi:hypothetical protein